jgi:hypothetical protein
MDPIHLRVLDPDPDPTRLWKVPDPVPDTTLHTGIYLRLLHTGTIDFREFKMAYKPQFLEKKLIWNKGTSIILSLELANC